MTRNGVPVGVLFNTDRLDGPAFIEYGQRCETAGIESVWVAELFGREPFAAAGALLMATSTLRVGTAIANIYARDAVATAAGSRTLAELSGERFELGIGVSNAGLVAARGHQWEPPIETANAYLDAIRAANLSCPAAEFTIHLAAHGPKMLDVAADRADGVFTYLMNPEHTERTRAHLHDDAEVTAMMMCLLCPDPTRARDLIRRAIGYYTTLDYYHRAWRSLGFEDADFADGGSDRLIDALVAWGTIDSIRQRLEAQRAAGATRVVVIPLNTEGGIEPDWELLAALGSSST